MTAFEQQVLKELTTIKRELSNIKKGKADSAKEYITLAEASQRFGVSERTIQNARREGKLTDFKFTSNGRNYRYSVDELEKLFAIKNK